MFLNDEDFEEFSCSVDECKMHSVDLAGKNIVEKNIIFEQIMESDK